MTDCSAAPGPKRIVTVAPAALLDRMFTWCRLRRVCPAALGAVAGGRPRSCSGPAAWNACHLPR
eukprot:3786727-Alexandrium_andersonii.AAC.1